MDCWTLLTRAYQHSVMNKETKKNISGKKGSLWAMTMALYFKPGPLFCIIAVIVCLPPAADLSIWWPQLHKLWTVWGINTENNAIGRLSELQKAEYFSHERAFCISSLSLLYHAVAMCWLDTVAVDIVVFSQVCVHVGIWVCVCLTNDSPNLL